MKLNDLTRSINICKSYLMLEVLPQVTLAYGYYKVRPYAWPFSFECSMCTENSQFTSYIFSNINLFNRITSALTKLLWPFASE